MVGVGCAIAVDLYGADDTQFQSLDVEYLIRYGLNASRVVGLHIGADIPEGRQCAEPW